MLEVFTDQSHKSDRIHSIAGPLGILLGVRPSLQPPPCSEHKPIIPLSGHAHARRQSHSARPGDPFSFCFTTLARRIGSWVPHASMGVPHPWPHPSTRHQGATARQHPSRSVAAPPAGEIHARPLSPSGLQRADGWQRGAVRGSLSSPRRDARPPLLPVGCAAPG